MTLGKSNLSVPEFVTGYFRTVTCYFTTVLNIILQSWDFVRTRIMCLALHLPPKCSKTEEDAAVVCIDVVVLQPRSNPPMSKYFI